MLVAWRDESGINGNYFPAAASQQRELRARERRPLAERPYRRRRSHRHSERLYDWGWLRADLGIAMPPSEQLEEIGALATLIDENRFSYSLDALCDWRGLPGKDTTLLEEAVKAAGFKVSKKNPLQSYIWQMPAHLVGPYAEEIRSPRWRYLRISARSSTRRAPATPIGWTSICCRWSTRCAGAASVSIKARPSRRATIACRNATCARRAVGAARRAHRHGRDRIANMVGTNL